MSDMEIMLNANGVLSQEQKEVLERKIPAGAIKTRSSGFGKELNYISGTTVIRLLNEAFGYKWSFQVLDIRTVQSLPKKDYKSGKETEQPPYVEVLGRLVVPSLGVVKEQFGTKALIGGESEQEGAAKAAATDALKKCATLLGIGADLYEDDFTGDGHTEAPKVTPEAKAKKTAGDWDAKDIAKLKELKAILGIDDNDKLSPFVREFKDSAKATYKDISPDNVKAFNIFLQKKAEEV